MCSDGVTSARDQVHIYNPTLGADRLLVTRRIQSSRIPPGGVARAGGEHWPGP